MAAGDTTPLAGAEIHGFQTAADLDIDKLQEEASTRWFRPNEIHAILSNYTRFKIQPQPIDNPTSGTILLFDRKMLRNFRKDGHNWKKKKDGKTVQEAHEKLKIGNEEKIHVYYAHSEDDPNFYRRCYWLLDKNLERIVFVHYRQTSEDNVLRYQPAPVGHTEASPSSNRMHYGSPIALLNSCSGSAASDMSSSAAMSEEINWRGTGMPLAGNSTEFRNLEFSLHDINTLDWDDLVELPKNIDVAICREGDILPSNQEMKNEIKYSINDGNFLHPQELVAVKDQERSATIFSSVNPDSQMADFKLNALTDNSTSDIFSEDFLHHNSLGRWNYMNDDSLGSLGDLQLEAPISIGQKLGAPVNTDQSSAQGQLFNITDVSPGWACCSEETKVLVVGYFFESHKHLATTNIYCVFGGAYVHAEAVQPGVYRCRALPHTPGVVNLYLTLDGVTPISQVLSFDYRAMPSFSLKGEVTSSEDENDELMCKEFHVQTRLANLLFSTTKSISLLSSGVPAKSLKEARKFALLTRPLMRKDWMNLLKQGSSNAASSQDLFELVLRNKLQEWLLEKIAEGCQTTALDSHGQGVIHLCAILDYAWAVRLFLLSGMSLDFRDSCGRTALHWAAYYGRKKMVAALLTAGANPSLVTDPTSENPGGCTAADLASKQGYEGLAAYLAEKGLTAHFLAMSVSGNINVPVPHSTSAMNSEIVSSENLSEQEVCLKESLAAYRTAADAADRIQTAFRERALKQQTRAVQLAEPVMEAEEIVAALTIQNAFRAHNRRKMMKAAARIQSHFRTWKTRRTFLDMRKHAIKIQAAFRGHQVRKQYRKIIWSVGVVEKAILRWRLKRKGLRGIHIESTEAMRVDVEEESTAEEEFYRISQEQAEERVQRSVTRVQAMFRSYRAQQEYRRMKEAHEKAKLEFNELNQQQEAAI